MKKTSGNCWTPQNKLLNIFSILLGKNKLGCFSSPEISCLQPKHYYGQYNFHSQPQFFYTKLIALQIIFEKMKT